ncbi:MAG: hypothetical protein WC748_06010 [Legionellales bacterium]|jgi:hypothetical protein
MDSIEEYHKKLADIYFKSNSEDYFRLAKKHYMKSIENVNSYIMIGNLYFDKRRFNIATIFYKKGLEQADQNISLKNRFVEQIKQCDDMLRPPSPGITLS